MITAQLVPLMFALGLGGLITSAFYYLISMIQEYITRKMICSVVVENLDPVYKWLLLFLTEKGYLADHMNDSVVRIVKKKRNWYEPK
jgi:hypothetical protein